MTGEVFATIVIACCGGIIGWTSPNLPVALVRGAIVLTIAAIIAKIAAVQL